MHIGRMGEGGILGKTPVGTSQFSPGSATMYSIITHIVNSYHKYSDKSLTQSRQNWVFYCY